MHDNKLTHDSVFGGTFNLKHTVLVPDRPISLIYGCTKEQIAHVAFNFASWCDCANTGPYLRLYLWHQYLYVISYIDTCNDVGLCIKL